MNREFLQLAHDFDLEKHRIGGMYMSEKLDGQRCFWDGGISRGLLVNQVPWANRDALGRTFNATGLWSRYGHPIHAPHWFVNSLPKIPLDGELYLGRGRFQENGFVRGHDSNHHLWQEVKLHVFHSPTYEQVFQEGRINNPNFQKIITSDVLKWVYEHGGERRLGRSFDHVYDNLKNVDLGPTAVLLHQEKLPLDELEAKAMVIETLQTVNSVKGEGLILADPHVVWLPKRTNTLLKVKQLHDAEATVIGYVSGRRTLKGSKLLGKIGALIVDWNGIKFELAGLNDEERRLSDPTFASMHPGVEMPEKITSPHFPRGSVVTFQYTELTDDGKPKCARYYRRYGG